MQMSQEEWEASIVRVGVVAACLVRKDDKYLLVQEKQPKAYGLWNLPAGHVDTGESVEVAAIREVKEETGYNVQLVKEVALYHETAPQTVKHVFTADIIDGELAPQEDEILAVRWLTFDEIKQINEDGKLRALWVWDVIQKDYLAIN
jgi:ADP-ribose pyrophosphatase YjhB (NUDIX family)